MIWRFCSLNNNAAGGINLSVIEDVVGPGMFDDTSSFKVSQVCFRKLPILGVTLEFWWHVHMRYWLGTPVL